MRGQKEVEDSDDNGNRGIFEKSLNGDMFEIAFDVDSDAILLGYPRYAGHTERLHRHYWKVKNSSLPAVQHIGLLYDPDHTSYGIPCLFCYL